MPVLSQQQRHNVINTNQAMQLHVEAINKYIANGGAKQTQEIEISINLMQKTLDTMKQQVKG
jgi:hypothetical protein